MRRSLNYPTSQVSRIFPSPVVKLISVVAGLTHLTLSGVSPVPEIVPTAYPFSLTSLVLGDDFLPTESAALAPLVHPLFASATGTLARLDLQMEYSDDVPFTTLSSQTSTSLLPRSSTSAFAPRTHHRPHSAPRSGFSRRWSRSTFGVSRPRIFASCARCSRAGCEPFGAIRRIGKSSRSALPCRQWRSLSFSSWDVTLRRSLSRSSTRRRGCHCC
jgi:hypothetical protein